jgi:hypothetical protein
MKQPMYFEDNEVAPVVRDLNRFLEWTKRKAGPLAVVGALGISAAAARGHMSTAEAAEPAPIPCAAEGSQYFTYDGEEYGINDAIFAIEGGGESEGDPCFATAKAAVTKALEYNGTAGAQYLETIVIPERLTPVTTVSQ